VRGEDAVARLVAQAKSQAFTDAAAWHTQQATEARRKLGPNVSSVDVEAVIRTHQKAAKHFRRLARRAAQAAQEDR